MEPTAGTGTLNGTADDFSLWKTSSVSTALATNITAISGYWKSNSEANPRIYADLGAAKDLAGLLINIDKTNTTETEIEIRASTDTTFTSPEVVRTILISDFTDDTDRFITIPRLSEDKRYVQIYGSSGSTVTLALNYVKYLAPTDFDRKHFHKYLDPTLTSANTLDSN